MGHMHFDISITLVLNIKLIVAKTNSWHTVLYVLNEEKDETPHKARVDTNFSKILFSIWIFIYFVFTILPCA